MNKGRKIDIESPKELLLVGVVLLAIDLINSRLKTLFDYDLGMGAFYLGVPALFSGCVLWLGDRFEHFLLSVKIVKCTFIAAAVGVGFFVIRVGLNGESWLYGVFAGVFGSVALLFLWVFTWRPASVLLSKFNTRKPVNIMNSGPTL